MLGGRRETLMGEGESWDIVCGDVFAARVEAGTYRDDEFEK